MRYRASVPSRIHHKNRKHASTPYNVEKNRVFGSLTWPYAQNGKRIQYYIPLPYYELLLLYMYVAMSTLSI